MKAYYQEGKMIIPFLSVTGVYPVMEKGDKNGDRTGPLLIFILGGQFNLTPGSGKKFTEEYTAWLKYNDHKENQMARMTGIFEAEPADDVSEMRFKSMDEKVDDTEIKDPSEIVSNDSILRQKSRE